MEMSIPATAFNLLQDLPLELREEIWQLCLPERVYELDVPRASETWGDDTDMAPSNKDPPFPCEIRQSFHLNKGPPVVSQICHESRRVALKAGRIMSEAVGDPSFRHPSSPGLLAWHPTPNIVHMNQTKVCEVYYDNIDDNPLHRLASKASKRAAGGSLTLQYLENLTYPLCPCLTMSGNCTRSLPDRSAEFNSQDLADLRQLPTWRVIMKTIVIHTDFKSAATTGLFGCLGDAPVQIIDASDLMKIDAYYKLAEECQRNDKRAIEQDLHRASLASMEQKLREVIVKHFKDDEAIADSMRPAIMFRLCVEGCSRKRYEEQKQKRKTAAAGGGSRGRGRGGYRFLG